MPLPYWLLPVAFICTVSARIFLARTFKKCSQKALHDCPAIEAAVCEVLHQNGINDVVVQKADGIAYADTYFPRSKMMMIHKRTAGGRDAISMCTAMQAAGRAIVISGNKPVYWIKYVLYPILRFSTAVSLPFAIVSLLSHNTVWLEAGVWFIDVFFITSVILGIVEKHVSSFGMRYLIPFAPQEEKLLKTVFAAIDLTYCSVALAGIAAPFQPLVRLFLRKTEPRAESQSDLA